MQCSMLLQLGVNAHAFIIMDNGHVVFHPKLNLTVCTDLCFGSLIGLHSTLKILLMMYHFACALTETYMSSYSVGLVCGPIEHPPVRR